jgi:hypothetical protein
MQWQMGLISGLMAATPDRHKSHADYRFHIC